MIERLDEEASLVVAHPFLERGEDFLAGEMLRREGKNLLGVDCQDVGGVALDRTVVVECVLVAIAGAGGVEREQGLGALDSHPAQLIDHAARHARQQVWIRPPEELDDDRPVGRLARADVAPFDGRDERALDGELGEPSRDGVDQLALFLQERPFVRDCVPARVEHVQRADGFAAHGDLRMLHPRRLEGARGLIDFAAEGDLREAVGRVLPARGDRLDHAAEDLADRHGVAAEDLVHVIEALQFLRALAKRVDDAVGGAVPGVIRGASAGLAGRRRSPSGRRRQSSAVRRGARGWRTRSPGRWAVARATPSRSAHRRRGER